MSKTITDKTDSLTAVMFVIGGGKFRLRKTSEFTAHVLDDDGNVIGSANRIYPDGYAVHTRPFGGYVNDSQIIFVEEEEG